MALTDYYKFYYIRDSEDHGDYGMLAVAYDSENISQADIDDIISVFMEQGLYDWHLDDIVDELNNKGISCEIVYIYDYLEIPR